MDAMFIAALENLEHQENALNSIRSNINNTRNDAFLLPDFIIIKNYRLSKDLFRYVINMLTPFIRKPTRKSTLDIQTKVSTYTIIFNHN